MRRTANGFTLVEVLITVSVVGILATIALPAFTSIIQNSRADSEVSDFQRALNYARMEAINRGVNIDVAPASGNNWGTAVQVKAGNTVLRSVAALSSGATLVTNSATQLTFNNLGGLIVPNASTVLTYTRGTITKTINVCLTGRIMLDRNC